MERILAHVQQTDNGCWIWTGFCDKNGASPILRVSKPKRKIVSARRYSYEAYNQVGVPASWVVTSICKNSKCVNPAHLTAQRRGVHSHRLIGSWKVEHCQRGHEFTEWNTGHHTSGNRFCIACDKNHARGYIAKRRTERHEYLKELRLTRSKALRQWVNEQKTPCIKCGESDPVCLDFHHSDPETKLFSIAEEAGNASREKLEAEIKKCIVICSNCHRKLHASERNAA